MTTKTITVRNDMESLKEVISLAEEFTGSLNLDSRKTMHIMLLAEETVGLISAITGDFEAKFWIEGNLDSCRLHLEAQTDMDAGKRRELMSVSSTGKNESTRGIMGKIRELFETGMENYSEVSSLQSDYGFGSIGYGEMGLDSSYAMTQASLVWTLSRYKDSVEQNMSSEEAAREAWDELEKSIVANIATDVRVGILRGNITLIIEKDFSTAS